MLMRARGACPALDRGAATRESSAPAQPFEDSIMRNTEEIWRLVDAKAPDAIGLADRVWGMPELCYAEVQLLRRAHRPAGSSTASA